jgi:phosphatidylglycerol---prolipoprotein diacylglyceryl transferase
VIWNVDPVLLRLGPFELRYYSLMFVIGFFSMDLYVKGLFKKYGKDPEFVSSLTTHLVLGMLFGSRLAHCLFYEPDYYLSNPIEILKVWEGGLASHGGYVGVMIAVWVYLRKHKDLTFLWIMDLIAGPCLFVGGLIRLGNFFNSEILGEPTSGAFGVVFTRIDQIPRHPAQLYEAVGYFTIACILMSVAKNKFLTWPRGINLAIAIILSFTFRFFIEYFKDEQSHLVLTEAVNMGQWLSLAFVLGGVGLLVKVIKAQPGKS